MVPNETVVPRRIRLHELEKITNGFSEESKIGSGGYGNVYKGSTEDGEMVAVKMFHGTVVLDHELFEKEYLNLASLQHRNIVRLVGYCNETQRVFMEYNGNVVLVEVTKTALCLEYMHNGSLENFLFDECTGPDWHTRYAIIKGICEGLEHLHEKLKDPMCHLDLKPANILLDQNMVPKLADFGISRILAEGKTQNTNNSVGTLGYIPPEFINDKLISMKYDIFSLGVVIIKIIAGPRGYTKSAKMLPHEFTNQVHENWRNRLHTPSVYVFDLYTKQVKTCIEIAISCLEADRDKRPSIGCIVRMLNETEDLIHKLTKCPCAFGNDPRSSVDQMSPEVSTETSELPDASKNGEGELLDASRKGEEKLRLLDIEPLQLHFPFEQNKLISCPLHLTNNADDHHVAFRCLPKNPELYLDGLSRLQGTLPPRSKCTYIVTMEIQQQLPADMDMLSIIVQVQHKGMLDTVDSFFGGVLKKNRGKVHEITLTAVCHPEGETVTTSQSIQPGIKIISCRDSFEKVNSIDVHPTEPWILAAHLDGTVSTWNYQTMARESISICSRGMFSFFSTVFKPLISAVKFIAREKWFVASDSSGYIHVHTCIRMEKLRKFRAYKTSIQSLAVHPSQPFLLSAHGNNQTKENLIKLWDWKAEWACIRTFQAQDFIATQVMFNPQNSNIFASASLDGTVKFWNVFDSNPIAKLVGKSSLISVDFFSMVGGERQYSIAGTWFHGTAQVWDLQTETCILELKGLQWGVWCTFNVGVVDFLPGHPLFITALEDNAVSLYNPTTRRFGNKVHFKLGNVKGFTYVTGIRSLIIGFEEGFAVMEIDSLLAHAHDKENSKGIQVDE